MPATPGNLQEAFATRTELNGFPNLASLIPTAVATPGRLHQARHGI